MRKLVMLVCLFALAIVPLSVSAQEATPVAVAPWVCPDGFAGQTLSVFNWTTYVAEDTISNFEAACGVTVSYDTYGSNEELFARLSGGNPGYDIVIPSDYMVAQMIGRDLLTELDRSKIPNFANLLPDLLDKGYDPGNVYSVPYQWGTIGIGYNTTKITEPITSWDQVFAYDGPVAWLDYLRAMIGVALVKLGYDPNSENPDEIAQARDYLVANGGNVVSIAGDDGQAQLARGDVDIAIEFSGDIFLIMDECGCDDFAYVIPEDGAAGWVDNIAIPVGAPNPDLAHAFIDYILDPKVGADISNYTAYATPNQAALDDGLIEEDLFNNPSIYPSDEVMARLFFIEERPAVEQVYTDAWDEIKILLGR